MRRTLQCALALLLLLALILTAGCSFKPSKLFGGLLRDAGLSQSEIDQFDEAYRQSMDELDKQMDQANREMAELADEVADELSQQAHDLTGQLADLAAGSDEAYRTFASLYSATRIPSPYEALASQAWDGQTIWNDAYDEARAHRLCTITDASGALTYPYLHTDDGGLNPYSTGQCTWYAFGRFYEDNGIALGDMGNAVTWLDGTRDWLRTVWKEQNPTADASSYREIDGSLAAGVFVSDGAEHVYPHSIAVCTSSQAAGHVLYIEDVEYVDGEPVTVYFSEANWKGVSSALDRWDGVLQSMPYSLFLTKRKVKGYIVPLSLYR